MSAAPAIISAAKSGGIAPRKGDGRKLLVGLIATGIVLAVLALIAVAGYQGAPAPSQVTFTVASFTAADPSNTTAGGNHPAEVHTTTGETYTVPDGAEQIASVKGARLRCLATRSDTWMGVKLSQRKLLRCTTR